MIVQDRNYPDKGGPRKPNSAKDWARSQLQSDQSRNERRLVFQDLEPVPFAARVTLATELRRWVDSLFATLFCKGYKQDEKREVFALLIQSLLQANCVGGAVMF